MLGPVYTVVMEPTTIVANATLVIVHADSTFSSKGSLLEVLRATVSQVDVETQQQLGAVIARKESAFGTYTSVTPRPHSIGGPISGIVGGTSGAEGTCGVDASAEGAGTVTIIHEEGFDNRAGFLWVPTPEERIIVGPDQAVIVKMVGTPTTLDNWVATLSYRELH